MPTSVLSLIDIRANAIRFGGGVRPFDHRRRRRTGRLSPAAAALSGGNDHNAQ